MSKTQTAGRKQRPKIGENVGFTYNKLILLT